MSFLILLFFVNRGRCSTRKYLCSASNIIGFPLAVIGGSFIPVGMYIAMYIKAKRIQRSAPQMGEYKGEENTAHNEQECASNQRAKVTVAILFVLLICLMLPFFLHFLIAPFFNTVPYYQYIYYVLNDSFILFPIADSVIIWRNKNIKEKAKDLFKKLHQVLHIKY